MKKILIPFILLVFVACSSQKKESFTINGKIKGKTPALVYLKTYKDGKEVIIDSCEFINGSFTFTGSVALPEMYQIQIGRRQAIAVFVENSEINIVANIDSLQNVQVNGSDIHNKYISYKGASAVFNTAMMKVYNQLKLANNEELATKLSKQLDSLYLAQTDFTKTYVKSNNKSVIAPYLINRVLVHSLNLAELEELTDTLSLEIKNSKYTKALLKRVDLLRNLQAGKPAPTFTQNDTAGNPISLSDFKGKFVLIDFWASWCQPCRRANPTMVKVFNKYKNKNFTILGISMDSDKDAWLKAIANDKLAWTHISSLTGWNNPVGKTYGVNSIPHGILINPDGIIVKRNIHPDELDETLSELLK